MGSSKVILQEQRILIVFSKDLKSLFASCTSHMNVVPCRCLSYLQPLCSILVWTSDTIPAGSELKC